jgi:hypothetical protein
MRAPTPHQLAALGVLALLAGCPKGQQPRSANRNLADFECNDRRAEYMVVGGFVADEAGVLMKCSDNGPELEKWRLGENGDRIASTHLLTAEQFEATWEKIDSSGWRFLDEDCDNPEAAVDDPAYTLDIGDSQLGVSLTCSGKKLPFPYDRIVNELDLRAAGFGDQDDPAR